MKLNVGDVVYRRDYLEYSGLDAWSKEVVKTVTAGKAYTYEKSELDRRLEDSEFVTQTVIFADGVRRSRMIGMIAVDEKAQEELDGLVMRTNLILGIKMVDWNSLSNSTLASIANLIDEDKKPDYSS